MFDPPTSSPLGKPKWLAKREFVRAFILAAKSGGDHQNIETIIDEAEIAWERTDDYGR